MPTAPPKERLYLLRGGEGKLRLTVDALAEFDDIPEFHSVVLLCGEVREYARTKGDIFIEIALSETIATELEFGGLNISQIGVENAEGVKFCNVVTTDLVCTDEKLDL
jgi:hypothetical protein